MNIGFLNSIGSSQRVFGRVAAGLAVLALLYLLIAAVGLIGVGFKSVTANDAKALFQLATNPVLGLLIGTVATALIQSSSTVTSIIVGLVAGGLPVSLAIPMVMGANIGTTVTNTLVSLAYMKDRHDFSRAFSAAVIHDQFNLLCVLIFLPLELLTGVLQKSGLFLAQFFVGGGIDIESLSFVKPAIAPVIAHTKHLVAGLPVSLHGIALIIVGIFLIIFTITLMSRVLRYLMVGPVLQILKAAVGRSPLSSITSGAVATVLVQSSSTTTSLMIPFAGSGILSLRQIYPFTLGANVGTCITALLAAMATSGAGAVFALQIALIHLLFNLAGVIIIYGIPALRVLPLIAAEGLAERCRHNPAYGFAYILLLFFVLPGVAIWLTTVLQ